MATGSQQSVRVMGNDYMRKFNVLTQTSLLALAAFGTLASAMAGANPSIGWNYGTITATPHYPIVGEPAHLAVVVTNPGDAAATNVRVKISFNDWGVTFQGWQEIITLTVPSIPAGGQTTVETDHAFANRTHTCLEALVVGADENTNPDDDRGQINLEIVNAGETFSWNVPVVNNGDHPLNLLLVGACKGRDAAQGDLPPGPCKEDVKEVQIGAGEELLVPIEIDLRGFAVGQALDFELNAYDLGAGGGAFLPQNGNGANIFAHTENAVQRILAAIDSGVDRNTKIALDTLARNLTDAARILAQANHGDASDIADGDDLRAAGQYKPAIGSYKHAWQHGN